MRAANRLRERGLAALSRAMDQHHWRIGQSLGQARLRIAGIEGIEGRSGHWPIVTFGAGQLQGLGSAK